MDDLQIKPILESILFVSESPVRLKTLLEIIPEAGKETILEGIRTLMKEYEDPSKGMELVEVAGGYQLRTKSQCAEWISRLKKAKPVKFSQSAMETLAIVAYRQPVIRSQIEAIRGVDAGWILRTLMEKGLIKMMGRKDLPGRPIIYGTTQGFLELFSLNSLQDLPTLKEIQPPPTEEEIPKAENEAEVEAEAEAKVEGTDTTNVHADAATPVQAPQPEGKVE
ncbi:MAG: SMC-Scp complex subunit ScpB [Desulfobacterales bacterium]|nr:SMC-Scp complex subunit ScpB [Desulfobacterales bacterium]